MPIMKEKPENPSPKSSEVRTVATDKAGDQERDAPIILPFESLSGADTRAFVTTRHGGVSRAPYDHLNLGLHVGDRRDDVLANRQLLAGALGIPPQALIFVDQVHGHHVLRVTGAERPSMGESNVGHLACADAMITDQPGFCLCIMVADCVPILLWDARTGAIGAAHAGWRGTVEDIGGRTVRAMQEAFGARSEDLHAAIGPSIGPEDFEVGPEVAAAFRKAFLLHHGDLIRAGDADRSFVDLWRANALHLEAAGVASDQIEISGRSTYAETDDFFSYRAEGGRTGRFVAGILRSPPPSASMGGAQGATIQNP
jgi:YfiH family protein